jgi:hypothetical protein
MSTTLLFYADSGLTTALTEQAVNHLIDGSNDPQDLTFYLGSTTSNKFRDMTNPGIDNLSIEIVNITALWQSGHAYVANDFVRTTAKNGYRYKVQAFTGGGISGGTEPAWPTTIGATVADNEVIWLCVGKLHESNEIRLALSLIGLGSSTPGASLVLTTLINGGAVNAIPIYMRIDDATAVIGSASELMLLVRNVAESAV